MSLQMPSAHWPATETTGGSSGHHLQMPAVRADLRNSRATNMPGGMQMRDAIQTLGYAIGATFAAACLGLLVVWVLINIQPQPTSGCEVKPANLRGVRK